MKREDSYLRAFEVYASGNIGVDPPWLNVLRKAAMDRFCALGFPTKRRGNEEWKYTDVTPIAIGEFHPINRSSASMLTLDQTKELLLGKSSPSRMVFLDGRFVPQLSLIPSMPDGVIVSDLTNAVTEHGPLVEQYLGQTADYWDNSFTALNTAFVGQGAFIYIPDKVFVEEPIELLFAFSSDSKKSALYPRVIIVTGRDSKATFIENYVGISRADYFANCVTEVRVGRGSKTTYYKVQRQNATSFHITNTHVVLSRDSSFSSVNLDFGGALVRNNLNVIMSEEGSTCSLNGIYMPAGDQHVDNEVIVDHIKGYTSTRESYRGVLTGNARSVFHGSIIVRKGSVKVDASQEDKNLLLSNTAEADTKPAFWIYCDDVRCAHGAACGQIDEDALFYLMSRGVSESEARAMLTRGFLTEIVDSIENPQFRSSVESLVEDRLDEWLNSDNPD